MKEPGLATGVGSPDFIALNSPFSNFDFVDKHYDSESAIRRLFSQARSHGSKTLVEERIKAEGVLLSENREISRIHPDYRMTGLKRLSFWNRSVKSVEDISKLSSDALVGYFIAKKDCVPSIQKDDWHVFEAVFRKYEHEHNCVPRQVAYPVRIANKSFQVTGVLYGQQNQLNKACAQVALRSLCSLHLPPGEITYERINKIAAQVRGAYEPKKGMSVARIRAVLKAFQLEFSDIDYSEEDSRSHLINQKLRRSRIIAAK